MSEIKIDGAAFHHNDGEPLGSTYLHTDKLTDDQRKQLLEALKEPQGGRLWLPKEDETYYGVDGGVVAEGIWCENKYQKEQFAQGNVFKTKAEAEKHAEYLKALYEVKVWIAENCPAWEPDWDNSFQKKHYIMYDHSNKKFVTDFTAAWYENHVIPCLETEQQCRDLIAAQSENLKRIFGVES